MMGGCIVWSLDLATERLWRVTTLYDKREVPANCAPAVSPDGRFLAVPHVSDAGELRTEFFALPGLAQTADRQLDVAWRGASQTKAEPLSDTNDAP